MLATGKKPIDSMTKSKMTKVLLSKYREMKGDNKFICQICESEYDEIMRHKWANCGHAFCGTCLWYYVNYKINRF